MGHAIGIMVVVCVCTMLTRVLPFWFFRGKKELPEAIKYLGRVLPPAIMMILVVYCLKNINFMTGSRGVPELLAVVLVILLHVWKRNTLLSIGAGTVFYMILIQAVFK
ncbi:MAG: AzlD domain-containing protein [Roseburia sp.]|nr:AzlD domain-containing protein [Roseburia sp.]